MSFNRDEYIQKMKKHSLSLINYLKKHGVDFKDSDGNLENVIFSKDGKIVKIAYNCFYRVSGLAVVYKNEVVYHKKDKKTQPTIRPVRVTDEMFYDLYFKSLLTEQFDI